MPNVVHTSSIKSEERSLGSILSDKHPLRVPAYQRSFSWTKSEITDFWTDLQNIMYENQEKHFLGSMVFIHKSDNSLEVVDGQQRLATVSLLLATIRDGFKKANDNLRAQHVETHYLCSRNLHTMEAFPKLMLNEIDNDFYSQIIESSKTFEETLAISKNKEIFESNRLIAGAYLSLFDFVQKGSSNFSNSEYLSNLVDAITENISCIQIITNSEDSAYVLFETLNARGIDLTLSDMLKNFLFSKAGKRLEEAKHKWAEIVTLIGQEFMKTFIRHEWMSRHGQTREKELYNRIKSEIRSNPKAMEYIGSLRDSAVVYDAISNPDHEIWTKHGAKCQGLLNEILLLGPIQCYPLILSTCFAKADELETVMRWIVNLTVRYSIICGKGTGNLENAYAKASSMIRKENCKLKDVKEVLLNIWPSDDEFKTLFREKTLTTPRIIKYILAKIELSNQGDASLIPNPEILSVEHILPKKPSAKWPQKMRRDDFLREFSNRIGNLTILTEPMNRESQSKEFAVKKKTYKDSKYKITQDLCSYSDWTEETILTHQRDLAEIAARTWKI